jgi:hypothetical protein
VARIFQQFIGSILLEWQIGIGDDSPVKIVALKGQHENSGEQCQRRCSSQLPNATLIEKSTDLKAANERGDSALQLFYFLLLLMLFGNIHDSPSFLILLMFSLKINISESEGLFTKYCVISLY